MEEITQLAQDPTEGALLNFAQAIQVVLDGGSVTKVEWQNADEYFYMKDGFLTLHTKGKDHTYSLRDVDLQGEDFVALS